MTFSNKFLEDYGTSSKGIITGDNNRFLRHWHEVCLKNINLHANNYTDAEQSDIKWYPCRKGGSVRKWYGNNEFIINWKNNGYEVIKCAQIEGRNCQDYSQQFKFQPSISWTSISSAMPSFRYGCNDLSESAGMTSCLALATLVALSSAALCKPAVSSLAILGTLSIGGTITKVEELANVLQVCLDSGAKKILIPISSAGDMSSVPAELMGKFNLIFYQSPEDAVFKALGVE